MSYFDFLPNAFQKFQTWILERWKFLLKKQPINVVILLVVATVHHLFEGMQTNLLRGRTRSWIRFKNFWW